MDYSKLFSVDNLRRFLEDDNNEFELSEFFGYRLEINRPFWFDNESIEKMKNMPLFTGSTHEEIFVKMQEYCLNNLKWDDGTSVDLVHYCRPDTKIFEELTNDNLNDEDNWQYINPLIKELLVNRLNFYGFGEGILDCCFHVVGMDIV
jgi:hypothetical protein